MSHFAEKVEHFYKNFWTLIQPYNSLVEEIGKNASKTSHVRDMVYSVLTQMSEKLRYDSDANLWGQEDYWANADEVAREMAGDCDDLALFGSSVLSNMGIPHYLTIGHLHEQISGLEATPEKAAGHVWLEVDDAGFTYILEFTRPTMYIIRTGDYSKVPYHPVEWVLVR